jgi:flagellar basal-body rod modification protein FlgD
MDTDISLAQTGILTKQEYDEANLVKTAGDDDLDRNAFLTLLTTQLQNQNPLDPMKNEEFVAQLAQFSQLEGITNMSTSLSEVADVIRSDRIMAGANLVGKSVFGQTGRITTDGFNAASIEFGLPYGADQVEVGIYDPVSGALKRSIVVGPQGSGTLKMAWDGRNADGSVAQPGSYIIRGNVVLGGKTEQVVPSTYSRVETVSWDALNADLNLNLAGGAVMPMAQVTRIGQEADGPSADSSETVNIGE